MKKVILLFTLFTLLIPFSLNSQWVRQNYPTQKQVNSIHFIDTLHGWITAGGNGGFGDSSIIYHTTTGGNNWIKQYVADSTWLVKIRFADLNIGYCAGGTYTFLKTINGGINWTKIPNPPGAWFDDIAVINKDTIYGCTASSFMDGIYKSTEGGQNFTRTYNTFTTKLFFTDYEHGWAVVGNFYLVRTTNAGQNWSTLGTWASSINDVFFIDANTGWLTYGQGYGDNKLIKTINGGMNWILIDSSRYIFPFSYGFGNIFFVTPSIGWCIGGQRFVGGVWKQIILKSTNGGINWGYQDLTDSAYSNHLFFLDSLHGWAYGANGYGYGNYTNNGGGPILILSIKPLSKIASSYKLYQNFPNPFNPTTVISYQIPNDEFVEVTVYDLLGKQVSKLVNEFQTLGNYSISFDASNLPSGTYVYTIKAGSYVESKKMVLMK